MVDSLILMERSGTANVAIETIGSTTMARIVLTIGGVKEVRLADYDVPPTALVLEIATLPVAYGGGHVEALAWPGRHRLQWSIRHTVDLYTAGFGLEAGPQLEVDLRAHWIDIDSAPDALASLAQAVVALGERMYDRIPVPANAAVELTFTRLLSERGGLISLSKRKLGKQTYEDMLTFHVPALAQKLGLPGLPVEVAAELATLRRLRNQVAHTGRPKKPIKADQAARCFAAAIFGYEYAAMLQVAASGS